MSGWRFLVAGSTLAMAILATDVLVGQSVPLLVPLSQLPLQLSGWTGRAEPIAAAIAERTHPDEVVNRRYADLMGRPVVLYIGYYAREASRGQVLALCGSCTILDSNAETFAILGQPFTVNRARILERDGVEEMVMYWFQSGGRVYRDPYRGKLEQLGRVLRYHHSEGALIRVSTRIAGSERETHTMLTSFLKAVVPALRPHFQDWESGTR